MLDSNITIDKFDEDYTSVEASAEIGDFNKTPAQDTMAAMKILEHYIESINN
jgi:hypothetical protein